MQDAKSPTLARLINSASVETVLAEALGFVTSAGVADAGEAAGTVVYAKLAKAPVLNLLGDTVGEYNPDSNFATSIVFTTGVLDSTKEIGFVDSGDLDKRLELTAAIVAAADDGAWACNYLTGLMVIKKKSAATSQTITSYKIIEESSSAMNIAQFGGGAVTLGQKTSAASIPVVLPSDAAANSGSASSGDATYMSPSDFTAVYASGTTLTLTGLSFIPTTGQFMSVKRQDTTGVSVTYTPDVKAFSYNSTTGVLTVTGAAFTATDVFVVTVIGPTKTLDTSTDAKRTSPIRDLSDQYVVEEVVNTTNVATGTYYYGVMDGYEDLSACGTLIDGAGETTTLSLEVSNVGGATAADWMQVYFRDDKNNTNVNSVSATNETKYFAISAPGLGSFKEFRWVITTSASTNTVKLTQKRKF